MNQEDLSPHVADIKRVLGDKLTEDQIKEELKKYFDLGILLSEAKRAIIKNFGGTPVQSQALTIKKLDQLSPTDSNVEFVFKLLSVLEKEVTFQGGKRNIFYGLLADDTMARPFTSWNSMTLKKGDLFRARGAYVKEFRGEMQVNFGITTLLEALDGTTFENVDIKSIVAGPTQQGLKIKDLKPESRNFSIVGKVMEIQPKEITAQAVKKTIYAGRLADETGSIGFTAWNDFSLNPSEVIKVSGGYIKNWRGILQINFDQGATVERQPAERLATVMDAVAMESLTLKQLVDSPSVANASVEGTVIALRPGSGLIFRCPECNKMIRDNTCLVHGKKEGTPDLRVKATLDDGLGNVTIILNRKMTESLLGMTLEDCIKMAQTAMRQDVVIDEISKKIMDRNYKVSGFIRRDDFGPMLFANETQPIALDVKAKAKQTLDTMEGW